MELCDNESSLKRGRSEKTYESIWKKSETLGEMLKDVMGVLTWITYKQLSVVSYERESYGTEHASPFRYVKSLMLFFDWNQTSTHWGKKGSQRSFNPITSERIVAAVKIASLSAFVKH